MDIINDLSGEEIVGTFCKKELQKINQREFRTEKVIRKKAINYMLTLISVGFLGVCFEVVGEVKLPLLSKTC